MIPFRLPWRRWARPSATLHEIRVRSEELTCDYIKTDRAVCQGGRRGSLASITVSICRTARVRIHGSFPAFFATNYMFEQAFKNIDDVLRKEGGCHTELDYTEQTSWLLFLKYLDDLERDKSAEGKLDGGKYTNILDKPYQWETWAVPKDKAGKLDHNKALTGDDLRDFVNAKLFPYLHGFKPKATGPTTLEYKIGEIFREIKNKIQTGYNFPKTIDHIA